MIWELNYPFPYPLEALVQLYAAFLDWLLHNDPDAVRDSRAQLRQRLALQEFEYMLWQEWKDCFRRREMECEIPLTSYFHTSYSPYLEVIANGNTHFRKNRARS